MYKFAIFNSFPFHYEFFGYLIEYFQSWQGSVIDIYTETANHMGWLNYFQQKFPNTFSYHYYTEYNPINDYTLVFLITDDDMRFKNEWFNEKTICIVHLVDRRPSAGNRCISLRYYRPSLEWVLPVYHVITPEEKERKIKKGQVVCVGGGYPNNIEELNEMIQNVSNLGGRNCNFICIQREFVGYEQYCTLQNVIFGRSVDTTEMINILIESEYVYIRDLGGPDKKDYTTNMMTSILPLAMSCLCKLVMSEKMNSNYKFKSAITYQNRDQVSMQTVWDEFQKLQDHKFTVLDKFIRKIPRIIFQTWETKQFEPEFQEIINRWKVFNPFYKYVLHDKTDREEFIRAHFPDNVYQAYCKIIPCAFKADLWRYCVLYIHGGIYTDVDMYCMGRLDDLISQTTDFVVPVDLNLSSSEGSHHLSNGFFAIKPHSDVMLFCISRIVYNVQNGIIPSSILDICGSGMMGRATNITLGREETASFIGMEGIAHSTDGKYEIHLLKFDKETECMCDVMNGQIILQNKNKNDEIIRLYQIECNKVKSIPWTASAPY